MKTLFQAIYARYQATALSDSLTDLYHVQAPDDAVFPYCVFTLVSDMPEGTFSEDFENCLLQFNLFSDIKSDSTEVCDLFELLKTAFDLLDLTVAGYTTVSFTRGLANLLKIEDVWQYTVTYRIILQKN